MDRLGHLACQTTGIMVPIMGDGILVVLGTSSQGIQSLAIVLAEVLHSTVPA